MSVDLRAEKTGGTWVRRFGDHEAAGFDVSVNDTSAHVTLRALGIMFEIDRQDVPVAWAKTIDAFQLRLELLDAIVRRMSSGIIEELLGEFHAQRQRAFVDGVNAARTKIREAIGPCFSVYHPTLPSVVVG